MDRSSTFRSLGGRLIRNIRHGISPRGGFGWGFQQNISPEKKAFMPHHRSPNRAEASRMQAEPAW